jgi:hypothetical protein
MVVHTTAQSQVLHASVDIDVSGQLWNYTLRNLEPMGSDNWITSFFLPINSPVSDILAPANWTIDSDNISFILWSNPEAFPYPDDIAPGNSLSGFSFTSNSSGQKVNSILSSWDHNADNPGPALTLSTLSPSSVPEPSAWSLVGAIIVMGIGVLLGRRMLRSRKISSAKAPHHDDRDLRH